MLPDSGVSTPASPSAVLEVDIRRFPWIKRLVADYAFNYPKLDRYYSGDPADGSAWSRVIERARSQRRDRSALAEILLRQQQERGAPAEALAAARQLADPDTVAVVTGQQAGLFGGPLFTVLKALTAVRIAERLRQEHGVAAIPIFWIDAEDHDWNEVKRCGVLDGNLEFHRVSVGDPAGAHTTPVARVRLDDSVVGALEEIERVLPRTEFTADLLRDLRRAYRPGAGMADAFGRFMDALLGGRGLVVFDSADPAAKPLVSGVFTREIENPGRTARLATETGESLQADGYHAQVVPTPDSVALFHLNAGREPVRTLGDGFAVGDTAIARGGLEQRAREAPREFSPNVLLRPIVQDTLFPTVCYVPGPSELAYLGQLKGVYEAFGVPMPLMYERATATILDSNAMRFLTRHELRPELLRARDEAALNDLLHAQLPPALDASLDEAARTVDAQLQAIVDTVGAVDATLEGAARSTLSRMQDELKKLHGKIIQAEKRKHETLRRQFHHAQAQAFPDGEPQERQVGTVYFLNKYGPALIDRLSDMLPGRMGVHYVLTV